MQTVRMVTRTAADGSLSLRIPLDQPEAEYEVVVVLQLATSSNGPTAGGERWPDGFLQETFGSVEDESFVRHPQGQLAEPVSFE